MLTIEQRLEICRKENEIVSLYRERQTIKHVSQQTGVSQGNVRKVLTAEGFWHGIDRTIEKRPGFSIIVGRRIEEFAYLLD